MKLTPKGLVVDTEIAVDRKDGNAPSTEHTRFQLNKDYNAGDNPAMVAAEVGFVMSGNYQSIRVTATCTLPSKPEPSHVGARYDLAFAASYWALNQQANKIEELAEAIDLRDRNGAVKKPPIVDIESDDIDEVMARVLHLPPEG